VAQTDEGRVRFGNDLLELEFDEATGHWLSLTDRRDGAVVMRAGETVLPVLLTVGGRAEARRGINKFLSVRDPQTVGLRWMLEGFERSAGDGARQWLTVRLREEDWRVDLRYGLRPGSARLERTVRIEYLGDDEPLLRCFTLRLPFTDLGSPRGCYLEAPGFAARPKRRVSYLTPGPVGIGTLGPFSDSPAWHPPLVGIHNPESRRAFLLRNQECSRTECSRTDAADPKRRARTTAAELANLRTSRRSAGD
jgi:hypothetical protein